MKFASVIKFALVIFIVFIFFAFFNTSEKIKLNINGKFLLEDNSTVIVELQSKSSEKDNWKSIKKFYIKHSNSYNLNFLIKNSNSILKLSYSADGYISQEKHIYSKGNTINLGIHKLVKFTEKNYEDYLNLKSLLKIDNIRDGMLKLKNINTSKSSPFFNTFISLQAILAIKQGDLYFLEKLKNHSNLLDRFWNNNLKNPFYFNSFDGNKIGPFEEKEFSLNLILENAYNFSNEALNELNKALFIENYKKNISDKYPYYNYKIFSELPFNLEFNKNFKFPKLFKKNSLKDFLKDYTEKIKEIINDFGEIGHRKLGDIKAREKFENKLSKYVPECFKLKKGFLNLNHSHHGNIEIINFYLNPIYEHSDKILVCTHYDSFSSNLNDPGANNGLSGVLTLIHLIQNKLFIEWCKLNKIGIYFHFYDAETAGNPGKREEYFLGSKHYVISEKEEATSFKFVLCADMVGVDFYYDNIIQSTNEDLTKYVLDIAKFMGAKIGEKLPIYDDHAIYKTIGIPATLLIKYKYEFYHTEQDNIDKLNPYCILSTASLIRNSIISKITID